MSVQAASVVVFAEYAWSPGEIQQVSFLPYIFVHNHLLYSSTSSQYGFDSCLHRRLGRDWGLSALLL